MEQSNSKSSQQGRTTLVHRWWLGLVIRVHFITHPSGRIFQVPWVQIKNCFNKFVPESGAHNGCVRCSGTICPLIRIRTELKSLNVGYRRKGVIEHTGAQYQSRIDNDWLKDFCSHYPDR